MDEETKSAEVKVGVFVVAALLILVVGSLWIAGSGFFGGGQTGYWVLMKSSGEVQAGDRVRMAGVAVGRIHLVMLRPGEEWPVALRVMIDSDIPLRTNSTARIVTAGLLGAGSLQISPGTKEAPLLEPGGEIRGKGAPNIEEVLARVDQISAQAVRGMDQMAGFMNQVSKEAQPFMTNVNTIFSKENAERTGKILSSLEETLDRSGPHLSSVLNRLDSIAERIDNDLGDSPSVFETMSALAKDLSTAIGPDGSRLTRVLDRSEETLSSTGAVMSVMADHRNDLSAAMRDLQVTASNLKEFSQAIKERPFSVTRIQTERDRRPGQRFKETSR